MDRVGLLFCGFGFGFTSLLFLLSYSFISYWLAFVVYYYYHALEERLWDHLRPWVVLDVHHSQGVSSGNDTNLRYKVHYSQKKPILTLCWVFIRSKKVEF